jgi:hypothetical protein
MIEKIKEASQYGFYCYVIEIGLLFGLGFSVADQFIWMLFDWLKTTNGIPLG